MRLGSKIGIGIGILIVIVGFFALGFTSLTLTDEETKQSSEEAEEQITNPIDAPINVKNPDEIVVPPRFSEEQISSAWNSPVTKYLPTTNDLAGSWKMGLSSNLYDKVPITDETNYNGQPALATGYNYKSPTLGTFHVGIWIGDGVIGEDPKTFPFDRVEPSEEWITPPDLPSNCALRFKEKQSFNDKFVYDWVLSCVVDDTGISAYQHSGRWETGIKGLIYLTQITLFKILN